MQEDQSFKAKLIECVKFELALFANFLLALKCASWQRDGDSCDVAMT
jgi:hypothetical protein